MSISGVLLKRFLPSQKILVRSVFGIHTQVPNNNKINLELYYKDISPPARAVYATIKHLGLPVNLKEVDLLGLQTRTPEFLKINPAHQVPILVDDGQVMGESRAIMSYLVNQYSPNHPIYPADPRTRVKIDRILYFETMNLFPAVRQVFRRTVRQRVPLPEEELENLRMAIDELLLLKGSNKFLAGNEPSLADISVGMGYKLLTFFRPEEVKKLDEWYNNLEASIPAVKEINDSIDFAPVIEMMNK